MEKYISFPNAFLNTIVNAFTINIEEVGGVKNIAY